MHIRPLGTTATGHSQDGWGCSLFIQPPQTPNYVPHGCFQVPGI